MADPTADEMRAFLDAEFCAGSEDSQFDVEETIYWFAADHHGGQGSRLYSALSTSEYTPGANTRAPHSEEAVAMYDALDAEFNPTK